MMARFNMTYAWLLLLSGAMSTALPSRAARVGTLSPDGRVEAVIADSAGLALSVNFDGRCILDSSPLGIYYDGADNRAHFGISDAGEPVTARVTYHTDKGKRSHVDRMIVRRCLDVSPHFRLHLVVADDGVAYAYEHVGEYKTVIGENSGFTFPAGTQAWLTQLAKGKSFWAETNPSYEDHYNGPVDINHESDSRQGWVYPALFRTPAGDYALVTETGLTGTYVATHLSEGRDNTLMVEMPMADQGHRYESIYPSVAGGSILSLIHI